MFSVIQEDTKTCKPHSVQFSYFSIELSLFTSCLNCSSRLFHKQAASKRTTSKRDDRNSSANGEGIKPIGGTPKCHGGFNTAVSHLLISGRTSSRHLALHQQTHRLPLVIRASLLENRLLPTILYQPGYYATHLVPAGIYQPADSYQPEDNDWLVGLVSELANIRLCSLFSPFS